LCALNIWRLRSLSAQEDTGTSGADGSADATATLAPEPMEVMGDLDRFADQPARQFEATIALYVRVANLAPEQRHLLLRGMFQSVAF